MLPRDRPGCDATKVVMLNVLFRLVSVRIRSWKRCGRTRKPKRELQKTEGSDLGIVQGFLRIQRLIDFSFGQYFSLCSRLTFLKKKKRKQVPLCEFFKLLLL